MIERWLPRSLTAQILLLALTGLVLAQIVSVQIYRTERNETLGLVNSRFALLRLVSAVRLLTDTPPELHREILRASRSESLMLRLQDEPLTLACENRCVADDFPIHLLAERLPLHFGVHDIRAKVGHAGGLMWWDVDFASTYEPVHMGRGQLRHGLTFEGPQVCV